MYKETITSIYFFISKGEKSGKKVMILILSLGRSLNFSLRMIFSMYNTFITLLQQYNGCLVI